MNDFLNPYIAGAPVVEPSMFFGRQDVFDWIEQNLSGRFVNHILVIHGQRRVGKTSVLKQIPNHLPSHFIHVFFDLQGRSHTSLDRFQWWLAREICRAVNQRNKESIPIPEHDLFAQDGEYLAAIFLPEVLSKLGESILLLTFDEFDTLSEPEIQQSLTKPLIAYLRRLFDLPNLNFIFSIGSSGHKLENMQASYTEFFKTALYRKISFLKQEDCSHLITQPVEGMLTYEPAAVERIYTITSGHPYFTQLICHELFSLSQKTGRRAITKDDVDFVLEDVIERGTVNLKFVWDEASDLEKWVLSSLAHELHAQEINQQTLGIKSQPVCTEAQLASALHNHHVRFSENDLNTALVHLREKDVLTQENHFVVELLSIWLLKNRPLDRVREELVQVNPIANRYNEIGDEFHALGQPDKAMESYRQAFSTDPSNLRAQVGIANLHLEGGNYDQALQGFEAALRIDDEDVTTRSGLCTALLALGEAALVADKLDEAGGYYQRILTINPDQSEAQLRLAALYTRQAEEALAAGEAEGALGYFQHALEYSPEDSQLAERYTEVKAEHTRQLIDELLKQSLQAEEKQDWEAALDTVQRALQLAPDDSELLNRLATVKEAPRLAKISSLRMHAQEMERLEQWDKAVQDWEACLQLHPEDEEAVHQSLKHARYGQKMAADYNLAQAAIKERHYSQAILLLQGVIAQDATYKDAAKLLVDCLKARPKQMLKLPVRWLRWTLLILLLIAVIVGIATQWSHLSPLLAGIGQQKTPLASQSAGITPPIQLTAGDIPPATQTAGEIPPPTATATGQEMQSFTWWVEKLTGGKAPDFQDDFSSVTLGEYWNNDEGAQKATFQDGILRLNNQFPIGQDSLTKMNYILQVDLRFIGISADEAFIYEVRLTSLEKHKTGYTLKIEPSNGRWALSVITDPLGQDTQIDGGNLGVIKDGKWNQLGIIVNEGTIGVFWDDKEILTQDKVELYGLINDFWLATSSAEATLDIDNWRFWDLGTPAYMRNDWITSATPTVVEDYFAAGQGWQFNPQENEKYEDGKAVLSTNGGDTFFSREDLQGSNVAMEVTFIPRDMSDSASLAWFLRVKPPSTDMFYYFEYFPGTGSWQIIKVENGNGTKLISGSTQTIPQDTMDTIMVVVNGDQISAFLGGTFLGSVECSFSGTGTWNSLDLRSNGVEYAQLDIAKIRFWDLDSVEWTTDDWITARPETVVIDSFTGKEGLQFSPAENEKYEDGKAVLFTEGGGETGLTRNDLQGVNIALEVSFVPRDIPDSAYLVWFLGEELSNGNRLEFNYSPKTGSWQICKVENNQWQELSSGTAQPTPLDTAVTIMVVADTDQARAYLNQAFIGSADIDRSGAGTWNELVIREKEGLYAQVDVSLIRFWELGTVEGVSGEAGTSLTESINQLTSGRSPDFQDDFSSASLQEYWANDKGATKAVLQDGALRQNNETLIGDGTLTSMNYILQVDLRFNRFSVYDNFVYSLRLTEFQNGKYGSEYLFYINPTSGDWVMKVTTDPYGQTTEINRGNLGVIQTNRWYELGSIVDMKTVSIYWDDKLLFTEDNCNLFGLINHIGLDRNSANQATLDIDNWRFWELETPTFMRNNWITDTTSTVMEDNFLLTDGFEFSPKENGEFKDYKAVLFTNGNETRLVHKNLSATNFVMEVSFSPRDMPDTASVVFFHSGKDTYRQFVIEYYPKTGFWQMMREYPANTVLLTSGWTQPTSQDSIGRMMVLVDGDQVSAFLGDTFMGYAESDLLEAQTWNEFGIRNFDGQFAQVDVEKISFWDLDTPELMIPERIYLLTPTVADDNFVPGEGWQFYPVENEKYEDGRAVLFTYGGDGTYLSQDSFQGTNIALEATFIPSDTPNRGALLWQIGKYEEDWIGFEYIFINGNWRIFHQENQQDKVVEENLSSGVVEPTLKGNSNTIMVVSSLDQVSAFVNGTLIGKVNIDRPITGTNNALAIISPESAYTRADMLKIRFWNLDK